MNPRSMAAMAMCLGTLICATGCGDGRAAGMIITGDGRMMANTGENTRDEAVRTIVSQLAPRLAPHWRITAAIAELPEYIEDPRGEVGGDWRWRHATVAIGLIGDTQAPLPVSAADIESAVTDYLRPKVIRAQDHLSVVVHSVESAASQSPAPASTGARTYTIAAGDTLADISAAFYGTSQHWRRIAEANPGLDPGQLVPGTSIVIPPAR
ncbi:MAG: LysM peptidoglycan-binding domain-containing protein [Planctomycetes bacterium]|nr:LysM peptidoglycan-binding domain-containing protein [Planctomycetota bacterium]